MVEIDPMYQEQFDREQKESRERLSQLFPIIPNGINWPEDINHENGNYMCTCLACGEQFQGHKRRVRCKQCSEYEAS